MGNGVLFKMSILVAFVVLLQSCGVVQHYEQQELTRKKLLAQQETAKKMKENGVCTFSFSSNDSAAIVQGREEEARACVEKQRLKVAQDSYPETKKILLACADPRGGLQDFGSHYYSVTPRDKVKKIVSDCYRKVSGRYDALKEQVIDEVTDNLYPLYVERDEMMAKRVQQEWAAEETENRRQEDEARRRAYDNSIESLIE